MVMTMRFAGLIRPVPIAEHAPPVALPAEKERARSSAKI